MDKELLRIAIIGTGLIIIVVMIVSAYLKDKAAHENDDDDYYDDDEEFDEDEFEECEFDDPVKKPSLIESLKSAYSQKVQQLQKHNDFVDHEFEPTFEPELKPESPKVHKEAEESKRVATADSILQFSVITRGDEDFNVADVFHVLESLGLEYGSMKIFERIDENRLVHFGVASMREPGTFPDEDLETHYCPGVVFFIQFDGLENPKAIFDDYVHTAAIFASEMDGVVLDHRRQPLTDAMVNAIRNSLDNY
jgi:cell division protein ZipA